MKHVALFLVVLCLSGCMVDDGYWPVPPVPPTPPTPPVPPDPVEKVTRDTFEALEVPGPASQLESLPPPERSVQVDDLTIHAWVLDEEREPGPGWVRWEVHQSGDTLVRSFAY